MREHARLWVGTIGIAVLVLALVWMLGDRSGRSAAPRDEPEGAIERVVLEPRAPDPAAPDPVAPDPVAEPREMAPEAARDLAARLARALDGGVRGAMPVAPAEGATTPEPPRGALRIEPARTAGDRLDYAAGVHDWIVLRRDDLRQRLAELERTGQGDSDQANRVRWEIARLDQTEPRARAHVEEVAGEAREEHAAPAGPPVAP